MKVFDSKSRRTRSLSSGLLFQPGGKRSQYEQTLRLRELQATLRRVALSYIGVFGIGISLRDSHHTGNGFARAHCETEMARLAAENTRMTLELHSAEHAQM
jgi:hypothetical protein